MTRDHFLITKRDGSSEQFSLDKIKNAILKAFASINESIDDHALQHLIDQLHFSNGMGVEEIQNQVEIALMSERHFKAAKAFMLYRKLHSDDRETADKLHFLINY